ncbi:MAG: hypothetical protein DRP42_07890 [Tenericutes bacterium]|nr:MAG: hypothetical protein DRP42_07890 [Mycoplasmatota bacterium]
MDNSDNIARIFKKFQTKGIFKRLQREGLKDGD